MVRPRCVICALFRRIELFPALSGSFFGHNSLNINPFHPWERLYLDQQPDLSTRLLRRFGILDLSRFESPCSEIKIIGHPKLLGGPHA